MWKKAGSAKYMGFLALLLLISGCGNEPGSGKVTGSAAPVPAVHSASSGTDRGAFAKDSEATSPGEAQITANPEEIKSFLNAGTIANGDIYLDGSTVHVNIAGLTPEIERSFEAQFTAGSYVLHDVKYTSQQLEAAVRLLADQDQYRKLNLYGSWIDVIQNKIGITIPDDHAGKVQEELEKLIDPGMLLYDVKKVGDAEVLGEIVGMETGERKRILILEPGQEQPSYWFSISGKSKMYDDEGNKISFSELQKGQKVKLWSTGTVEDSFPAQATVRRLELDRE